MTLSQQIMLAVSLGGRRAHPRYLPEISALVCKGKMRLVKADHTEIIVEPVVIDDRHLLDGVERS